MQVMPQVVAHGHLATLRALPRSSPLSSSSTSSKRGPYTSTTTRSRPPWREPEDARAMTGTILVQRPVHEPGGGGRAGIGANIGTCRGADVLQPEDPTHASLEVEESDPMRNPFPRARSTAEYSNIDVTPSSASTTTTSRAIGGRLLKRPTSHRTNASGVSSSSSSSESSTSRASPLTTITRYNARGGHVNQPTPQADDSKSCGNNIATTSLPVLQHSSTGARVFSSSSSRPDNTRSNRPRGLVGLQNLGNTCFMNSCLQCISNLPMVVQYFQSGAYTKEINDSSPTKGALATAFGDLIKALWTSPEFTSTRPVDLKRVIGKVASRFTGYEQQDAQEFLRFLLDGLHEDLNRIIKKPPYYEIKDLPNALDRDVSTQYWNFYVERNHSAMSELFCGQLRSEIRCNTCSKRSLCFDVFWDLSVPVPKKPKPSSHMRIANVFGSASSSSTSSPHSSGSISSSSSSGCSVEDCLKAYTDLENMQESDAYYCSSCKTHRSVTKKISLYRLPSVLVVHLKRFSYSTFSRDKVTTPVRYPAHGLDLTDYCAPDAIVDGSTLYDLAGIVHHVGSLNGGHYTAECMNADTSDWYDFNDGSVSSIKRPQLSSGSAYILFYRRRDEQSLTI